MQRALNEKYFSSPAHILFNAVNLYGEPECQKHVYFKIGKITEFTFQILMVF